MIIWVAHNTLITSLYIAVNCCMGLSIIINLQGEMNGIFSSENGEAEEQLVSSVLSFN